MKKSTTYRSLVRILCLTIFLGVTLPSGLHAMSEDECSAMMQHPAPDTGHEDCPMPEMNKPSEDHNAVALKVHDYGFACACSIDQAPVTTESTVIQKQTPSVSVLTHLVSSLDPDLQDRPVTMTNIRESLSPPPIYLLNASFLN